MTETLSCSLCEEDIHPDHPRVVCNLGTSIDIFDPTPSLPATSSVHLECYGEHMDVNEEHNERMINRLWDRRGEWK